MKTSLCICASMFILGNAALQAEDAGPKPVAHQQLTAASVKDGVLTGSSSQTVTETVTQAKTELRDGKPVTVLVAVPVTKTVVVTSTYSLKDSKATGVDGKEIAAADWADKVKAAKTVHIFSKTTKPSAADIAKYDAGTVLIELLERK